MGISYADIEGWTCKGGTITTLRKILGNDGSPIVRADVTSISYSVVMLDEWDPTIETSITGHTNVAVVVADVVFDTLQTGPLWSYDAAGYNFAHTLDIGANPAFATPGRTYRVDYVLVMASGQPIRVRTIVRVD